MNSASGPPTDTVQVRCPRLGHQISFSYCRTENIGLPCSRIILCWQHYFAVADYLHQELTEDEWRSAFAQPGKAKILTLVELIDQARKR